MSDFDCPFGAECTRSKVVEEDLAIVTKKIEAMDLHLAALAARIRVLQVIVIGGWLLDFVVKTPKAQAMTLAFLGRVGP